MKVAVFSDTHGRHERLSVPAVDLAVCCGDVTVRGSRAETEVFLRWFGAQGARRRILVPGNHDSWLESDLPAARALARDHGVEVLVDEGLEIEGLRVWGSPVTPAWRSLAYNRVRGAEIAAHWAQIPEGLDLLITHGPPKGIGDWALLGGAVGCEDLLHHVRRAAPKVHVFGHIHEAAGEFRDPHVATRFINAASSRLLVGMRSPVVVDL